MDPPLLSIGLPVRNGQNYLAATLQSLLSQTFKNFELIISDNASTDRTAEICLAAAAADPRVVYHRFDVNVGASKNYNHVFHLARGEYFKWAAHDDICLPNHFEVCLAHFARSPSVVAVYPRTKLIDAAGQVTGEDPLTLSVVDGRPHQRLENLYLHIRLANPLMGVLRSSALRQTRLIDRFVGSDIVLLAELLMLGEFREIPEFLFCRRLHEERSLKANSTQKELLVWFDPAHRNRRVFVSAQMRLTWEFLRSVWRTPLPLGDRLLCLAVTLRWRPWQTLCWHSSRAWWRLKNLSRRARRMLKSEKV